jgi:hypothetical protein
MSKDEEIEALSLSDLKVFGDMLPEVEQFAKIIGSIHNCFALRHRLSASVSHIREISNIHHPKHSIPSIGHLTEHVENLHGMSHAQPPDVLALTRLVSN